MITDRTKSDKQSDTLAWDLWFYWIMATTSGWLIGNLLFSGIPIVISGVVIAAMQWAVLFKRIEKAWQWFVLSSFAWIISMIVMVLFLPAADLFHGLFLGSMLGVTQWAILRKHFFLAGWWIPISILAWTTGLVLMPGIFTSGALPGALSGLTLVIFFRYSKKVAPEKEVNGEV
jgi:hypothetical protein